MPLEKTTLKEILYTVFGKQFPISGGYGNTINNPIVVHLDDPNNYAHITYSIIKHIAQLRNVSWKIIDQELIEHHGKHIDKIQIETEEKTEDQVITQTENYYFCK